VTGSDEQALVLLSACCLRMTTCCYNFCIKQVMIFKNGKKMDTIIGAVPKSTLVQAVEK
jgi:hypothetical protein